MEVKYKKIVLKSVDYNKLGFKRANFQMIKKCEEMSAMVKNPLKDKDTREYIKSRKEQFEIKLAEIKNSDYPDNIKDILLQTETEEFEFDCNDRKEKLINKLNTDVTLWKQIGSVFIENNDKVSFGKSFDAPAYIDAVATIIADFFLRSAESNS